MACNSDFIEFVYSQIAGSDEVHSCKMFGNYVIYITDKPVMNVLKMIQKNELIHLYRTWNSQIGSKDLKKA